MPIIDVGPQRVSFREAGQGFPAVLLLHAAGGSSLSFDAVLHHMASHGRHVVALDLPGHGNSPALDPAPAADDLLERYRDLAAEAAERLGLGRFVVAGHSMGGAVAQLMALDLGERLAGMVLIATAARLKVAPAVLDAIHNHFDQLPTLLAAVGYSPATDRDQAARWAREQIQAEREVMLADFLACAVFDQRQRVGAVDCPVWILSAADDLLTPLSLQERLQQLIPRSRLQVVTRAGHFLPLERPDVVARCLLEAAGVDLPQEPPLGA